MRETSPNASDVPAIPHTGEVHVAIVRSSYYPELLTALEDSAQRTLLGAGLRKEHIHVITVPGSFEIPLVCKKLTEGRGIDGIIALGLIIQGETFHAGEIARACTDGIMHVQLESGIPITHGMLFCKTLEQAKVRCMGEHSKGREAAQALLGMLAAMHPLSHHKPA